MLSSKPILIVLALWLSWLPPHDAMGESAQGRRQQAKALFAKAEIHYNVGEFSQALTFYRQAYKLVSLPGFQFNMAQCYRHLGRWHRALFFYRRYLGSAATLTDEHRREVKTFIATCQKEIAKAGAATRPSKPEQPSQPAAAPVTTRPPPKKVPPPAILPKKHAQLETVSATPWWFWAGIGTAATTLAVGALTGYLAQSKNDEYLDSRTSPARASELKEDGQTLAALSTATLVVGVVSAAVSLTLYLLHRRYGKERKPVPNGALKAQWQGTSVMVRF